MADKYTKSAQGQECQVRLYGICNHNPETVVLAHLNGAGMGRKHANIHGAYACSACHAVLDGAMKSEYTKVELSLAHLQATVRTQQIMIAEGVLKL